MPFFHKWGSLLPRDSLSQSSSNIYKVCIGIIDTNTFDLTIAIHLSNSWCNKRIIYLCIELFSVSFDFTRVAHIPYTGQELTVLKQHLCKNQYIVLYLEFLICLGLLFKAEYSNPQYSNNSHYSIKSISIKTPRH